jgi:hypothetical protein
MPLNINFDKKGRWTGTARLPSHLQDISDLKTWISNFLLLTKKIGKTYIKLMSNDQKLVGQEKAILVSKMSSLFGALVLLRKYLTDGEQEEFRSLKNSYNYEFHVKTDSINWYGKGWFGSKYTHKLTDFRTWYNDVILKKIREALQRYALSMGDSVFTDEERDNLVRFVETIMFDVLVIIKALITMDIDR